MGAWSYLTILNNLGLNYQCFFLSYRVWCCQSSAWGFSLEISAPHALMHSTSLDKTEVNNCVQQLYSAVYQRIHAYCGTKPTTTICKRQSWCIFYTCLTLTLKIWSLGRLYISHVIKILKHVVYFTQLWSNKFTFSHAQQGPLKIGA